MINLTKPILAAAVFALAATAAHAQSRVTYKSAKTTSSYYQMAVRYLRR